MITANGANWKSALIVLLFAGLTTAIASAYFHDLWLTLTSGTLFASAVVLSFIYRPKDEPYTVARALFWLVLVCSWSLMEQARDHALRRGALITGIIAAIGSLVAYEMKLRMARKSGGEAR